VPPALLLADMNGRTALHFAVAAVGTEGADTGCVRRMLRYAELDALWTRAAGPKVFIGVVFLFKSWV
jgi:hypothetical protein